MVTDGAVKRRGDCGVGLGEGGEEFLLVGACHGGELRFCVRSGYGLRGGGGLRLRG